MRPEAFELDDQARNEVVRYFSSLPRTAPSQMLDGGVARLVTHGEPSRDIPACAECHGPGATDRNPAYPILDGQPADYLFEQLVLLAENRRGGSQFGPIMQMIAARLSAAEMREAAEYYSSR